jgi:predicted transcriptional regulator of viral defense system
MDAPFLAARSSVTRFANVSANECDAKLEGYAARFALPDHLIRLASGEPAVATGVDLGISFAILASCRANNHSPKSGKDKVLELVRQAGVLRPRDLDAEGIPREYLRRLLAEGLLDRRGWGIYVAAELKPTPNQTLAEASKRVPHGVVCLLSALQFHELSTQAPFEVWLAIGEKARRPKVEHPPLRIVRFSGPALADEVAEHRIEGVTVKVYRPAKTVADCFKYRNKIGLDVALEALRDCWKKRRATMDELWQAAKTCRVANVMRPYLESLT